MDSNHRRSFLKQVGGLAAVAAAPAAASAQQSPRSAPAGATEASRAYASSRFPATTRGSSEGGWNRAGGPG